MGQVSLLGYATAGAFLNLGFFDLYYTLLVIIVATRQEVSRVLVTAAPITTMTSPALQRKRMHQAGSRRPIAAGR
jgi:hypothetical protein